MYIFTFGSKMKYMAEWMIQYQHPHSQVKSSFFYRVSHIKIEESKSLSETMTYFTLANGQIQSNPAGWRALVDNMDWKWKHHTDRPCISVCEEVVRTELTAPEILSSLPSNLFETKSWFKIQGRNQGNRNKSKSRGANLIIFTNLSVI